MVVRGDESRRKLVRNEQLVGDGVRQLAESKRGPEACASRKRKSVGARLDAEVSTVPVSSNSRAFARAEVTALQRVTSVRLPLANDSRSSAVCSSMNEK